MNEIDKGKLTHQLRLISAAESVLDQLLSTTMEDHHYGRGFSSAYPTQALDNMITMRLCIEMELKHEH
jgi:hypothetical protein